MNLKKVANNLVNEIIKDVTTPALESFVWNEDGSADVIVRYPDGRKTLLKNCRIERSEIFDYDKDRAQLNVEIFAKVDVPVETIQINFTLEPFIKPEGETQ